MQIIDSLFQHDLNHDFRNELVEEIKTEIARLNSGHPATPRLLVRISKWARLEHRDFVWLLLGSVFLLFLVQVVFITIVAVSRENSQLSLGDLRNAAAIAPAYFLGLVCFPIGLIPLSAKRGQRNALYPVEDDSVARWAWIVAFSLFAILFFASIYGAFGFLATAADIPLLPTLLFCILNALLLTSVALIVIRFTPPNFEYGSIAVGPIVFFAVNAMSAVASKGISIGGYSKILGITLSPTAWATNLFFEAYFGDSYWAWLLLIPVLVTIWSGYCTFCRLQKSRPTTNYFESKINSKLSTKLKRELVQNRMSNGGKKPTKYPDSLSETQEAEQSIKQRLDFFSNRPSGVWECFLYRFKTARIGQLFSCKNSGQSKFSILRFFFMIGGLTWLVLVYLRIQANPATVRHFALGMFEGALIGIGSISSSAMITGGACPRRYPMGYWSGILDATKMSLLNLIAVLPIYTVYMTLISSIQSLTLAEMFQHLQAAVSVWILFAGFALPVGFPICNKGVRLVLGWIYCLVGTIVFVSPLWIAIHYQIARLAAETPPEVLNQNLGVFMILAHPKTEAFAICLIALAGLVHLAGYSFLYAVWQRDYYGLPIRFSDAE